MSSSFGTEANVNVHFVIPSSKNSEDNCTEDMKKAFQVCVDHSLSTNWVPEKDCLNLHPEKTDVFIFEEFTGSAFGYLQTFSCIIIGPRCILDCLAADIMIPKCNFPLFTVAMRDLVVTTTGFSEPQKLLLGENIRHMGGTHIAEYRQSLTHLVVNRPGSAKYEKALENNIPVMSEEWVEAVWEESKKRNVHACDEEFQKYKCSVFHNLIVTCSQIPRRQKEQLKSNINNNGGQFCGELEAGRTNVVVVAKPFGDKFNYAKLWKIPCVTPAWVSESIKKGQALPFTYFAITDLCKSSTPEHGKAGGMPDISVSFIEAPASHVNETVMAESTMTSRVTNDTVASVKPLESPKKNKHMQLINKISVSDVKKAGVFLDGCNIYFSGFSPEYTEKLRRIINSGGATRFNEISESVTHVIVGDFVESDIKILKSQGFRLHVVTVEWLVESIRLRCAAPEDKFPCLDDLPSPIEFQSPLSKKGFLVLHTQSKKHVRTIDMSSLKNVNSPKKPLMPKNLFEQYASDDKSGDETTIKKDNSKSVSQNDQDNTVQNEANSVTRFEHPERGTSGAAEHSDHTQSSGTTSTERKFFNGLTFSIAGYTAADTKEVKHLITCTGGKVVERRFKGIPDYGVVPVHGAALFHTTSELVTHIWLDDCVDEGILLPVKYYHQPVNLEEYKPLSGCVVTTTSYNGPELRFIIELMEGLGAVNQSMMARVDRPGDGLVATTHLVCPDNADLTASRKYKAACKWGIPCVSHHWLLSCAKEGKRVDEETFIVTPDSQDCSMVIAKTPMAQGMKRKFCDDDTGAAPSSSVPVGTILQAGNAAQSPTSNHMTPRAIATPVLRTPRLNTSGQSTPVDTSFVTPRAPGDISTPETPYGQIFTDNPSPKTRKMWKKWIDQWPEEPAFKAPPPRERRNSTPMAELIQRGWQKFAVEPYMKKFGRCYDENGSQGDHPHVEPGSSQTETHKSLKAPSQRMLPKDDSVSATPEAGIHTQLQELKQILDSASKSSGSDNQSTPRVPPVKGLSQAPESLDLCSDFVEWVDPVVSNQQKPTPVFMLSSFDRREECDEIIRSLGGIVSSSQIYDPMTTHLVCQQPARNEKLLSCIAAGKWVLEKRFLEDSKKQGHFLDEENYEWGNPKAQYQHKLYKKGSLNELLAKAIHRWRCKIQESGKGAFSGMKAIVCASKEKTELYKRLILAGGGEVANVCPPFSDPGNATLCILELAKVPHRVDLQALVDKKVPCVPPLYLNDFLITDPCPDVADCLIPEYKALL